MQSRRSTIRLIQLAMAASLVIPCLAFAVASWFSYGQLAALADERIIRSLDVQQEQALKAFQLVDITLKNATALVANLSEADIRRDAERLHAQFKELVAAAPIVQSVWVYGKDGHALATSSVHPPPAQSFADRDFIIAHAGADAGTYYGQ